MTAVEAIPFANARVRIKRDVLFTETNDGVLFHNAHGGFHLAGRSAYRFATLVVPYLNGEYQVQQLCEILPPAHHMMVSSLVRMLLERGLARDVLAADASAPVLLEPAVLARFGEQIEYIDHYEDRATERFLRFRNARVVVLGEDAVAGWCALGVIRNGGAHVAVGDCAKFDQAAKEATELTEAGCPVTVERLPRAELLLDWAALADADIVVCTGSGAPAQVLRLLGDGVPEGKRLLPITMYGRRVVAGPMSVPGRAGCWSCAMLRLGFNGDSAAAADVWRSVALGGSDLGHRPGRELSALLGNLLAYEVFREFTQAMPAETEGSVIVQEIDSFDTTVASVAPHPQCPLCAPARSRLTPKNDFSRLPLVQPADSRPSTVEGEDASIAGLDKLTQTAVSKVAGVFRKFDDDWPVQLPLRVSRLQFGVGTGQRRTVTAFDLHHVAAARMRAFRLAAATYVDLVLPVPGRAVNDSLATIPAARLATYSGMSGTDSIRQWVPAQSLLDGSKTQVPAAAVRPYGPANAEGVFTPSGAGLGVGSSVADATYRALLSAVAHRALRQVIRSGAEVSVVDGGTGIDEELVFLDRCAVDTHAWVELLRLDTAEAVTVLLARARDETGAALWSIGCDLSPARAAKTALRDVLGQRQIIAQRPGELDLGHRLVESFDPYTIRATDGAPFRQTTPAPTSDLLASLRSSGCEAYAVLDDAPDLRKVGIHAVRVLLATVEQA